MRQITDRIFPHWIQDELKPEKLLSSLTSGVLMGVTEVIFALSVGSLIFSGELEPFLPYGIGIALVTTIIMLIGISFNSSILGTTGSLQDSASVILAVVAAALVGALPATGGKDRLTTVLVAIATTALLTGAFFLVLGYFKLGRLVRFLPYPVVGGFLAGTGWLLVKGSFGVMADFPLAISNLSALLQLNQMILWIPGVLLAAALLVGMRRTNHLLVMPGILFVAISLFYVGLLVTGTSIDDAVDQGLVLGEMSSKAIWQPLALENMLAADWAAILGQSGNMATILIVSVIGLLLNASALELAFQQDIDLNRELRVAGFANLLSGLSGGAVGYHALDLSTLSYRIGVPARLPGLVAGTMCAVMLLVGSPLLAFFPKPILGGLLLFMGLGFLVEWVIDGWSKLTRADYAVVLVILAVIGATNFLIGVGVGLLAMIVLFVLNYSRIDVVRHALTGAEMKSNVERRAYHRQVLRELGQSIYILELQGFIFFGTANALLERIRSRISDLAQPQLGYIILDFRRVTGLDSSAVLSFVKGRQLAEAHGVTLLLTHIPGKIRHQFRLGGLSEDGTRVRIFPDLDHGLEWCENQLLQIKEITRETVPVTLAAQLVESGFEKAHTLRLLEFLEQVQIEKGAYLIQQGKEANALYLIEQGTVSVYMELENGERVRLQTLGPGTVVGELGLYQGMTRTASVVAVTPAIAYRLSRSALLAMKEKEPELAAAFHEFIARLLSERLAATDRLLEAVLR